MIPFAVALLGAAAVGHGFRMDTIETDEETATKTNVLTPKTFLDCSRRTNITTSNIFGTRVMTGVIPDEPHFRSGTECLGGMRAWRASIEDKQRCEETVAYVPYDFSSAVVPCFYLPLAGDPDGRYGCLAGDTKQPCQNSTIEHLIAGVREKWLQDCVNKLCFMAREGSWRRESKQDLAKSSPWPKFWTRGTWSQSKGWMTVAGEQCPRHRYHGQRIVDWDVLRERVSVGESMTFNKTLCACKSEDDCSDEA
mmetsp:Transcript_40063/g.74690  ORF Transcript_40063/g.74690 Transcript_40063/m.74690 type:complete len:252 (-) Transcript_40063:39-794(-)